MTFQTVHYTIHIDDPAKRPNTSFSAVLLSDLHNTEFGSENALLISKIREINPAFVLSAGDLVTAKGGRYGVDKAAALVKRLGESYPVYLISGNHEMRLQGERYPGIYTSYIETIGADALERCKGDGASGTTPEAVNRYEQPVPGVFLMDNRSEYLMVNGMRICLNGYAVPLTHYSRSHRRPIETDMLTDVLGSPDEQAYQILAAHHPDGFPAYAQWGADLTVSGHIHGGTIRLPFLGGVIGASLRPFPPFTRGLYQQKVTRNSKTFVGSMILSAGLGSHTIKLRINNPPELVVLDFCAD